MKTFVDAAGNTLTQLEEGDIVVVSKPCGGPIIEKAKIVSLPLECNRYTWTFSVKEQGRDGAFIFIKDNAISLAYTESIQGE